MLAKINKNTLKANLRRGIPFKGYMAGNNVNSFHIVSGWHLGCPVECSTIEELEEYARNFLWYLEPELGRRVSFWVEK